MVQKNTVTQSKATVSGRQKGRVKQSRKAIPTSYLLVKDNNFVLLHTDNGTDHPSFELLDSQTETVHISGPLFIWMIAELKSRAPGLKTIQVIPTREADLCLSHYQRASEFGLEIVFGYYKPQGAWSGNEVRSKDYWKNRKFFLKLEPEKLNTFKQLVEWNFKEALLCQRYFCLNGEDFLPYRLLRQEFGPPNYRCLTIWVNGLVKFLDSEADVGGQAENHAGNIAKRFQRLKSEAEWLKRLGLQKRPQKLRAAMIPVFEQVLPFFQHDQLKNLRNKNPNCHAVLVLRYGLEDRVCRSFAEVGQNLGFNGSRAEQLEKKALKILGISV